MEIHSPKYIPTQFDFTTPKNQGTSFFPQTTERRNNSQTNAQISHTAETPQANKDFVQRLIQERKQKAFQEKPQSSLASQLAKAKSKVQSQLQGQPQQSRFDFSSPKAGYTAQAAPHSMTQIFQSHLKSPNAQQLDMISPRYHSEESIKRPNSAPPTRYKTKEQLLKESQDKFRKECTFKPKISRLPRNKSLNYNSRGNYSRQEWLKQISTPKTEIIERRERLRREMEDSKDGECTFQPKITNSASTSRCSTMPVQERLYAEASKYHERERQKRVNEEAKANAFPYKPSISRQKSVERVSSPLYMRFDEIQKERNENRQRLQQESEENNPDLKFKPQINKKSAKLAVQRQYRNNESNLSIGDRLSRQWSRNESQMDSNTLNLSKTSFSTYNSGQNFGDFYERQMKTLQKVEKLRNKELLKREKSLTFRPNIDKKSEVMVLSNRKGDSEKAYERLSIEDSHRRQTMQSQLSSDYYSQFSYTPAINELSKKLARNTSVEKMSQNEQGKELRIQKAIERANELDKECHFSPRVNNNRKYLNIQSGYSQKENITKQIAETQQKRQQRIDEFKQNREKSEKDQCTFTPTANQPRVDLGQTVVVRGMDRFMEVRKLHQRQRELQTEHEQKVFKSGQTYNPHQTYTVPRPFNIKQSQKSEKVNKVQEYLEQNLKKELTFKPNLTLNRATSERNFLDKKYSYLLKHQVYIKWKLAKMSSLTRLNLTRRSRKNRLFGNL